MTEDEVIQRLQGYDGVILGLEPMSERVMHACPQLKVVSLHQTAPGTVDEQRSVLHPLQLLRADHIAGLLCQRRVQRDEICLVDLARSISVANRDVKRGEWNKYTGYPVWGAALGIIGLGAIGKGMASTLSIPTPKRDTTFSCGQACITRSDIVPTLRKLKNKKKDVPSAG